jgi:zinc protease
VNKNLLIGLLVGAALLVPRVMALELKTERYTLKNGLTVILHEDARSPNVTVNFLVKVGSKDELERRSGFAHLFEHLMFMGTKRVGVGQYDKIIESYGGNNNAFTAPDMTLYYSSAPAKALPTLLWLEADRLEALGENIDQKKLDLQRAVVLNERRQSVENTPYGEADEAINQLIYPLDHPYHRGTIGSPSDLNAATVDDVKAFFATYYVPNNISLLVAGNFKSSDVKPQIEKLFAGLARQNDTLRKSVPARVSLGTKRVTFVDRVSQPRVSMVWRVPKIGSDDFLKLDVVTTAMQNRINEVLLDEGVASDAYIYVQGGLLESQVNFTAFPGDGVSVATLEQKMDAVLADFNKTGISAAELKSAVAATEKTLIGTMQNLVDRAQAMNIDSYYYSNPNYTLQSLERYKKLTSAQVSNSSRMYLVSHDRLIQTVLPLVETTAASTRDTRPSDANSVGFTFPKSTEFKLKNGMSVSYWQSGQFPMTYFNLSSNQGTGSERVTGSTQLLAAFLDKGSKTKNFSRTLTSLGADITSSADAKQTALSGKTLSRNLEPSLGLITEALSSPLLTKDEFENEQANLNFEREGLVDNPRSLSLEIAMTAFHGANHPLGRFVSPSQVKKLSLDQIKIRYAEVINPKNINVFMAGDLSAVTVKSMLEKTLGAWQSKSSPQAAMPLPAPALSKARLLFVDRPDSAQTFIRVFTPTIGFNNTSYLEYNTLGMVLGGTFTSRLVANLREDKGYTYGIGAGIIFERTYGILNTRSAVESSVTGESIKEILKEFNLLSEKGISDEETVKATQSLQSGLLESVGTPENIVATASALSTEGRSFANLITESNALNKISTTAVNALAKTSIQQENAIWVLVGDKKTVLPQLEGLGLPAPEDIVPNP